MNVGYTVSFPFQVDEENTGYILLNKVKSVVGQNLTNLLLTSPGERIMDPEFGVGIRKFLFENRTSALLETIKGRINSQARKYMPFITIQQVEFQTSQENENYLGIGIYFLINATQELSTLWIESEDNRVGLNGIRGTGITVSLR